MIIRVDLPSREYDIVLERGSLRRVGELLSLDRRVLIVTDEGVPREYAECVAAQCREAHIVTVPMGECSKNLDNFEMLCRTMLEKHFTRADCAVAVGGGVVGDLTGFAAASYMRGIDFYNIPTTLLSQVDSSIGGKVAVNLAGVKNIIGAFYQPRAVIIDPDVLYTLPRRHLMNGFAEAVKMALTSDETLFSIFEEGRAEREIETVIERSLRIKKSVVEADERESGLRCVLNFGHTLGHGIESVTSLHHGECVALGMIPMCSPIVRERLVRVLSDLELPVNLDCDLEQVLSVAAHDKKCEGEMISDVYVEEIGSFEIRKMSVLQWREELLTVLNRRNEQ